MPEIKELALDLWEELKSDAWDSLVTLKLLTHNTRLVESRRERGLNQMEAAHQCGIPVHRYRQIETLRLVPTEEAKAKIAIFLGKPIDYLFPDTLVRAIEAGVFERRHADLAEPQVISLTEAQRLRLTCDGETEIIGRVDRKLLRLKIDQALDRITPQERLVISLRFGLDDGRSRTLEEVGQDPQLDVTRERVRQIEAKALRKLRHPACLRILKPYLD